MGHERRDVWAKRVERWADSGLTAREFAAEIGVNANTLAHWRWRLNARSVAKPRPAARSTAPAFVEVVAATGVVGASTEESPVAPEPFELVLPSGVRVRVSAAFDGGALKRLVATLEAC